jgi:prepilin-type N-terminal cleavage/methylation domain-containing protein
MHQNEKPDMRTRKSGFTLVEVMTAVAILALIAAITFSVVFGTVKRSRFIDRKLDLENEAASVLKLIAEDIRSAYVQEGVVPYFEGTDVYSRDNPIDEVKLLTTAVLPVSPELLTGSAGEVEYQVEEDDEGNFILLRREQTPAEAPFDDGGTRYKVTDRIKSLDLAFSDGEDWFDEWDSQSETSFAGQKLPSKVRIELTLEEEGTEVTNRTIVAPVMAVGR